MKILILTASNPYIAAGIVALDLYTGLSAFNGNEVRMIVKAHGKYQDKNIIPFEGRVIHHKNRFFRMFKRIFIKLKIYRPAISKADIDYSIQDYDQTITYYSTKKILQKADIKPDVIIVLFMQNFLSYKNLFELNKMANAPVYLYMMDMASMTGGCHYAWNCKEYHNKCGCCPAFNSNEENDQSRENWLFKKEYIDKTNITLIAGTEYQFRQLTLSSLFKDKPCYKALISVNENVFKPQNKIGARNHFSLPANKKIIFFGAVNVTSRRKGFNELIESLKILKLVMTEPNDTHLVIAGHCNTYLEQNLPFDYSILGNLNHAQLALAFQAADVFICTSIEDSGPTMINQAIMSGIPVVSFEMGVAFDLVKTGATGYRAKLKDSHDLAHGIKYVLELKEQEYIKMSENCRRLGLELCHLQTQVENFINIFKVNNINEN